MKIFSWAEALIISIALISRKLLESFKGAKSSGSLTKEVLSESLVSEDGLVLPEQKLFDSLKILLKRSWKISFLITIIFCIIYLIVFINLGYVPSTDKLIFINYKDIYDLSREAEYILPFKIYRIFDLVFIFLSVLLIRMSIIFVLDRKGARVFFERDGSLKAQIRSLTMFLFLPINIAGPMIAWTSGPAYNLQGFIAAGVMSFFMTLGMIFFVVISRIVPIVIKPIARVVIGWLEK